MWIVDALRPQPHPSHFSLKQALAWIERLAPKRAILTHMTFDLDYEALRRELPPHVEPAPTAWWCRRTDGALPPRLLSED